MLHRSLSASATASPSNKHATAQIVMLVPEFFFLFLLIYHCSNVIKFNHYYQMHATVNGIQKPLTWRIDSWNTAYNIILESPKTLRRCIVSQLETSRLS